MFQKPRLRDCQTVPELNLREKYAEYKLERKKKNYKIKEIGKHFGDAGL